MKPYKTFIILFILLVFLFGPSYFIRERVSLVSGVSIRMPALPLQENLNRFLDTLLSRRSRTINPDNTEGDTANIIIAMQDYLVETGDTAGTANSKSGLIADEAIQPVEYPADSIIVHGFIDSIRYNDQQVRVLYYGDSQLEGDRITDSLRTGLREYFGGSGPGLLSPTILVPYTRTVNLKASDNWERYTWLDVKKGVINDKNLGPLLHISRYLPPGTKSKNNVAAWITVTPSVFADDASSNYPVLRIFYGNLTDTIDLIISCTGLADVKTKLAPVDTVAEYRLNTDCRGEMKIVFEGSVSPDIYGFSLESDSGLVLDNISSRGSAGLEFSLVHSKEFAGLIRMIDPDLLIMQFGLNVVLNIKEDYKFYEDGIVRQIEALKDICPNTKILVISLTDMAKDDMGKPVSFVNIPLIRDAQRNAARRSGAYFWDAFNAMGGSGSIIAWHDSVPSLASDDYAHLSYPGGHRLASMLLRSMTWKGQTVADTLISKMNEATDSIGTDIRAVESQPSDDRNLMQQIADEVLGFSPGRDFNFITIGFWLFLLVVTLFYSLFSSGTGARNGYLFIISLLFYYISGGLFFVLLIISTLTDYIAGMIIYKSQTRSVRRLFVVISLIINLGMLSYFKYTGFVTANINNLLGTDIEPINWLARFSNGLFGTSFDMGAIILPVGISFFTFQTISYTIDVYRGKTRAVRNILDFGFYVSFFPQLVAGPIVRASEFIPQLYQKFSLSKREWSHAIFLILNGLIKKIVVSDFIATHLTDWVFADPGNFSGFENLLAVYGYGLQIYCDFSGYTDIAIGIALLLGFRLPVNFNSPYKAINITDFWRRWHISLSRWLKDYLYIPLGGNRKGKLRTNINLMLTMLIGGLWHGAAWRFVIWGGLHGIGLTVHKWWLSVRGERKHTGRTGRFLAIFVTFNFVSLAWIFFRAGSTGDAIEMLRRIFTHFKPDNTNSVIMLAGGPAIMIVAGYIIHLLPVRIKESYRGFFIRMPLLVKLLIVYITAILLFNIQAGSVQPFIYFRF